jgi:hypothetical protein
LNFSQAFVAELAVEALRDAILLGLPRLDKAVLIACASIQDNGAFETNSGPLSLRRKAGAPRSLTSFVSTSITRPDRIRPATSIANPSLAHLLQFEHGCMT